MIAKVIRHIQIQIGCLQLEYVFFYQDHYIKHIFCWTKILSREKQHDYWQNVPDNSYSSRVCLEPGSRFLRFVEVWLLATNYNNTILELLVLNFGRVIRLICIDFVLSEIQPYSDWYLL